MPDCLIFTPAVFADLLKKELGYPPGKLKIYTEIALCLMLIEQPDKSAIHVKTRYDRSSLQPSQVFSIAIDRFGLVCEASVPANKNYSYTS